MKLTYARLEEALNYDPETGLFTWKVKLNRRIIIGAVAGSPDARYWLLRIDGRQYYAHRCAFLYMNGEWPSYHVDHISGDGFDNRWVNLRDVSQSGNMQNLRCAMKTNRSGLLGVSLNGNRFGSSIYVDGASKWLGNFKTPEEAHAAYLQAKRQLHAGCTI